MKYNKVLILFIFVSFIRGEGRAADLNNGFEILYTYELTDTTISPVPNRPLGIDSKVIAASGDNTIEISPLSSFNNAALIQPINRTLNSGVSTALFLKDTASWSFYTNSQRRLNISGSGYISTSVPLLINNSVADGSSALRVNGQATVDSLFSVRAASDSNSFISISRNIQNFNGVADDGISPFTTTPTAWAANVTNIPAFRIRHPLNVSGVPFPNTSVQRDFLIVPYQYGMAIEYNGVVECWVGEWSVHRGLAYYDVEGKGNGWGGVLWVGDDQDRGGIRATARNNTPVGGSISYGELSVEKFAGEPNGDFRLRLPSTQNEFQFVYGERGSENIIAKMKNDGLVIPKVSSSDVVPLPEKAQITFDSATAQFKGYNGTEWMILSGDEDKTGSFVTSATGAALTYSIPHGLAVAPSYFSVIATSPDSANISYVTADATSLVIHYIVAPAAGSNNLSWNWQVKK